MARPLKSRIDRLLDQLPTDPETARQVLLLTEGLKHLSSLTAQDLAQEDRLGGMLDDAVRPALDLAVLPDDFLAIRDSLCGCLRAMLEIRLGRRDPMPPPPQVQPIPPRPPSPARPAGD